MKAQLPLRGVGNWRFYGGATGALLPGWRLQALEAASSLWLLLQVYFWEFQRKNQTERLRTLFMPEGGVKLKNLTGYTTYVISVAPFNAAGDGPRSPPTRGRTQQAGAWVPHRDGQSQAEESLFGVNTSASSRVCLLVGGCWC